MDSEKVELIAKETGESRFFNSEHAARILAYDKKIGKINWEIPQNKDGKKQPDTGSGNNKDTEE